MVLGTPVRVCIVFGLVKKSCIKEFKLANNERVKMLLSWHIECDSLSSRLEITDI